MIASNYKNLKEGLIQFYTKEKVRTQLFDLFTQHLNGSKMPYYQGYQAFINYQTFANPLEIAIPLNYIIHLIYQYNLEHQCGPGDEIATMLAKAYILETIIEIANDNPELTIKNNGMQTFLCYKIDQKTAQSTKTQKHNSILDIPPDVWKWKNVAPKDIADSDGTVVINKEILDRLDDLISLLASSGKAACVIPNDIIEPGGCTVFTILMKSEHFDQATADTIINVKGFRIINSRQHVNNHVILNILNITDGAKNANLMPDQFLHKEQRPYQFVTRVY